MDMSSFTISLCLFIGLMTTAAGQSCDNGDVCAPDEVCFSWNAFPLGTSDAPSGYCTKTTDMGRTCKFPTSTIHKKPYAVVDRIPCAIDLDCIDMHWGGLGFCQIHKSKAA